MVKKPTFFIVGAPRSGTTAMYEFLKAHPEIFMTAHKEPHYFATDLKPRNPWMKSLRKKRNCLKLFSFAKKEKQLGEASVLYLVSKKAARNIKNFNPQAKIIIMLRSPLEVMYSLYYQLFYGGDETTRTFSEALDLEKERKKGKNFPQSLQMKQVYLYREDTKFSQQVKRYLDCFPRNQIKIIIYEDLKKNPRKVYQDLLRFLAVDPNFLPEFRRVNPNRILKNARLQRLMNRTALFLSQYGFDLYLFLRPLYRKFESLNLKSGRRPPMDLQLERKLKREYLPEIKRLSVLVGRNLTFWCH